jgi:hypothetical protein
MSLSIPKPSPTLLAALVLAPAIATAQVSRRSDAVAAPTGRTLPMSSPTATGATLAQPLPAPTNLAVTPSGTSAALRWDAVPGATGYVVSRTSARYGTVQQTPTPLTTTSFTDVSQQFDPGFLHTYVVSAVYPDGRMGAATVVYLPPPASVARPLREGNQNIGATGWRTRWTAVPEATGYVVRYQMQLTNGLNAYWNVDTSFAVSAPTTEHWVGEWNGSKGLGNAPTRINSAAVSAVFPNGGRSAATSAR